MDADHSCSRFVGAEGHRVDDFRPMLTVQITDDPPARPVEERPDRYTLLKQVAEMYRRGDKLKHIAQAIGYSIGGVSDLVDEAYDLGLIDAFRRPKQREANKRRKGVIVVPVDQTKSNGQATAKPAIANEEEAAMLFEALTALNEDSLRALYGEIEREMGRRVLRGV